MPHSLWDTLDRFEQPPLSMISVDQVEASQTFQEWLCARPETTIVAVLSSIEDSESLLVHFTRNNTFWASRFFFFTCSIHYHRGSSKLGSQSGAPVDYQESRVFFHVFLPAAFN